MIADAISSGHVWGADLLFLIAFIVFAVSVVLIVIKHAYATVLLPAGLALVALGLFIS